MFSKPTTSAKSDENSGLSYGPPTSRQPNFQNISGVLCSAAGAVVKLENLQDYENYAMDTSNSSANANNLLNAAVFSTQLAHHGMAIHHSFQTVSNMAFSNSDTGSIFKCLMDWCGFISADTRKFEKHFRVHLNDGGVRKESSFCNTCNSSINAVNISGELTHMIKYHARKFYAKVNQEKNDEIVTDIDSTGSSDVADIISIDNIEPEAEEKNEKEQNYELITNIEIEEMFACMNASGTPETLDIIALIPTQPEALKNENLCDSQCLGVVDKHLDDAEEANLMQCVDSSISENIEPPATSEVIQKSSKRDNPNSSSSGSSRGNYKSSSKLRSSSSHKSSTSKSKTSKSSSSEDKKTREKSKPDSTKLESKCDKKTDEKRSRSDKPRSNPSTSSKSSSKSSANKTSELSHRTQCDKPKSSGCKSSAKRNVESSPSHDVSPDKKARHRSPLSVTKTVQSELKQIENSSENKVEGKPSTGEDKTKVNVTVSNAKEISSLVENDPPSTSSGENGKHAKTETTTTPLQYEFGTIPSRKILGKIPKKVPMAASSPIETPVSSFVVPNAEPVTQQKSPSPAQTMVRVNANELMPWAINLKRQNFKYKHVYELMTTKNALIGLYKCMDMNCSYVSSNFKSFMLHLKLHVSDSSESTFHQLCPYCKFQQKETSVLARHIKFLHSYDKFQCSLCFFRSSEVGTVHEHLFIHHKQPTAIIYRCPGNAVRSEKKIGEREIAMRNRNVRKISCKFCHFEFFTIDGLKSHLKFTHKIHWEDLKAEERDSYGKLYQRLYCSFDTSRLDEMSQHMINHPTESRSCCSRGAENSPHREIYSVTRIELFMNRLVTTEGFGSNGIFEMFCIK